MRNFEVSTCASKSVYKCKSPNTSKVYPINNLWCEKFYTIKCIIKNSSLMSKIELLQEVTPGHAKPSQQILNRTVFK